MKATHRVIQERQRLELKRIELEVKMQNDWNEITSEIGSGRILVKGVSHFLLKKLYKSNIPGGALIAGGTHMALAFADRIQPVSLSNAIDFVQSASRKIVSRIKQIFF